VTVVHIMAPINANVDHAKYRQVFYNDRVSSQPFRVDSFYFAVRNSVGHINTCTDRTDQANSNIF